MKNDKKTLDAAFSKKRAAVELIIPFVLITLTIQLFLKGSLWYLKFATAPLVLAFIIFTQIKSRVSSYEQGLKPKEWKTPIFKILLPSLLIGLAIVTAGLVLQLVPKKYPSWFLLHVIFIGYPVWGIVQEYIVIVFMLQRLNIMFENSKAPFYIAALIFSTAHLPNPFLVVATFFMSMLWITMFKRYKNIYILGACHGILGACAKFFLPHFLTYNFKIGNLISWKALFYSLNI